MKQTRTKRARLRNWVATFAAILVLLTGGSGLLSLLVNKQVDATVPAQPQPAYSMKFNRGFGGDTVRADNCSLKLNTPGAAPHGDIFGTLAAQTGFTDDQYNTFKEAANPDGSVVTISMTGSSNCDKYGLVFVQSQGSDRTLFYGTQVNNNVGTSAWMTSDMANVDTNGSGAHILPTSKSIDFYWQTDFSEFNFTLNNVANNPSWAKIIGSGGGAGSTAGSNTCPDNKLSEIGANQQADHKAQLSECVGKYAPQAHYINFSTISFAGGTYTLKSWSGAAASSDPDGGNDQFRYVLTSSPNDPDLMKGNSGGLSYLDLSTNNSYNSKSGTHNSADLNIDNDNGVGDAASDLDKIFSDPGAKLSLRLVVYNQNGTYYTDTKNNQIWVGDINALSLPIVAKYYGPKSQNNPKDTIDTYGIIQDAGSNESAFMGTYVKSPTAGIGYVLSSSTTKCSADTQKPHFTFDQDLSKAAAGSVVSGRWNMVDGSCNNHVTGIKILVAADTENAATHPGGGNGTQDTKATCESSGFPLSWIICAGINLLSKAVNGIYDNAIVPLLKVKPMVADTSNPTYVAWSNFRIYGNIFLVIALIVVVFGESIGGGLIDAYTAKKVLPRLLIAAILINLSFYIVAILVDIMNVLGGGLKDLLTAPFGVKGGFSLNDKAVGSSFDFVLIAGAAFAAHSIIPELAAMLMVFVLLPALLIFIAIMVTILLRQALIIVLTIVAPVAFALYVLPNTEQYFKKWWDALFKTLLVYPIIAVLFALGNIMSRVIGNITDSGATQIVAPLFTVIALLIPLLLIPFAFRLAGGIIGKGHDLLTNYGKKAHQGILGNPNDPFSTRNMTKRRASNAVLNKREGIVAAGNRLQVGGNRGFGRRLAGGAIARLGGSGNYEVRRSLRNKEATDMVSAQVGTGGDSTVRALFARKMNYIDKNGVRQSGYFGTAARTDANGNVIGADTPQFSEFEYDKAQQLYGSNQSLYQAALTYEVGKAGSDDELATIMRQHAANMRTASFGGRQGEVWTGTAYSHQQTRRELKHTKMKDGVYARDGRNFTREVAENVGNYPLSNMRTSTIDALEDDFDAAQAHLTLNDSNSTAEQRQEALNTQARLQQKAQEKGITQKPMSVDDAQEIVRYVRATADSLDARRQTTGSYALAGEGDESTPISGAQTGAPGLVSQKINNLVDKARTPGRPSSRGGSGPGAQS